MDQFLQALAQGLLIGATYGLLALGMGLIYSVSGIVNFSHGDFVTFGMFLCFAIYSGLAMDPYLSIIITVPLLMAVGALIYKFLIKPIAGHHLLMVIQLTLGMTFVLQNGFLLVFGGQPLRVPSVVETSLIMLGPVVLRTPQVIAFCASFMLAGLLYAVLRSTDVGRKIRAVNQNQRAAALMGINVSRIQIGTFATGIGLLAIAASLIIPGTSISPTMGLRYTVITLLVVVLGGMTNFVAIMVAGLLIGISEVMGTIYVSDSLGMMLPYAFFVMVMLFRPQGITFKLR